MVELTVPWEERVEEAHHMKKTKYEDLVRSSRPRNGSAGCFQWKWGAGASQPIACGAHSAS